MGGVTAFSRKSCHSQFVSIGSSAAIHSTRSILRWQESPILNDFPGPIAARAARCSSRILVSMHDTNLTSDPSLALPAVVITGATEGIGRALAEEFARDGHNLVLVARDSTKLARTAAELASAHAVEVKVTAQDLATT